MIPDLTQAQYSLVASGGPWPIGTRPERSNSTALRAPSSGSTEQPLVPADFWGEGSETVTLLGQIGASHSVATAWAPQPPEPPQLEGDASSLSDGVGEDTQVQPIRLPTVDVEARVPTPPLGGTPSPQAAYQALLVAQGVPERIEGMPLRLEARFAKTGVLCTCGSGSLAARTEADLRALGPGHCVKTHRSACGRASVIWVLGCKLACQMVVRARPALRTSSSARRLLKSART